MTAHLIERSPLAGRHRHIYKVQLFTHPVSFPIKFRPPKIFGSKNLGFGVMFRGLEDSVDEPIKFDFGSESEMLIPSEECVVDFGENFHFLLLPQSAKFRYSAPQ